VVTLLLACLALAAAVPLINHDSPTVIPDQYMVVFHKNSTVAIRDLHVQELKTKRFSHPDETILGTFDIGNLIGYSARFTKKTLAEELLHPNVRYIEADQEVHIVAEGTVTQTGLAGGLWGLSRVDEQLRNEPSPNSYTYWASSGNSVTAYIIDTGILITHADFGGRARYGANFVGEADPDLNGHGTHVAGTIGGTQYGLAKKATLVAVKVLSAGGSGSWAGVVSGIDWVTKDHVARGRDARSVANMSLGGGKTVTVDDAVEASIKEGVNHVVAAGNSAADACNSSPSGAPNAITVGATDSGDNRASFSNYGTCVDIFAPGVNILSSWIGASNIVTSTISGTSMASPHVAGAVAVRLGHELAEGILEPSAPAVIARWLTEVSTKNQVLNPGTGSPNTLLYSPFSEVIPEL